MVHHPFNLIDRRFWGAAENFSAGPLLNQSIVTTIALFHTRSPMCYNTRMCSLVLRDMQVKIFEFLNYFNSSTILI